MNRSRSAATAVVAACISIGAVCSRLHADIVLDDFTTPIGAGTTQTFGEWGYQTWNAPSVSGAGVLGTRTLSSRVWGNGLPYSPLATLTTNSPTTARLQTSAGVSGWNNVGYTRLDIGYGNFGTLDLRSPQMTELLIRGNGTFSNWRGGSSVSVFMTDSTGSQVGYSHFLHDGNAGANVSLTDIRIPLAGFDIGADFNLAAVTSVTIRFNAYISGDGWASSDYEIDSLSIIPAPAAAPLLALAGLTARSRRRR